jgi:type II secretory pathway component PulM
LIRQKFFKQAPRTQLLQVGIAAVGLGVLAVWGVLLPAHTRLAESQVELERSGKSLVEMQELAASYRAMAESDAEGTYPGLTAVVNRSLQGRNFQPSRIQRNGTGGLVLRVDNVSFQLAVEWIHELENTQGLAVETLALSQSQGGLVSLTLALNGL